MFKLTHNLANENLSVAQSLTPGGHRIYSPSVKNLAANNTSVTESESLSPGGPRIHKDSEPAQSLAADNADIDEVELVSIHNQPGVKAPETPKLNLSNDPPNNAEQDAKKKTSRQLEQANKHLRIALWAQQASSVEDPFIHRPEQLPQLPSKSVVFSTMQPNAVGLETLSGVTSVESRTSTSSHPHRKSSKRSTTRISREIKTMEGLALRLTHLYKKRDKLSKK